MINTAVDTPTLTPTPVNTPDKFEIKDPLFYPNPYGVSQPPHFSFYATQSAGSVTLKIYSVSFRLLAKENIGACPAGQATKQAAAQTFSRLANGTYYYVITAVNYSGKSASSKIRQLIIIR